MGDDQGGPRREFFRILMKELQESELFEGQSLQKLFSHNIEALERKKYKMAGQLVAMSLVQGGPGLHCLHVNLYNMMFSIDDNNEIFEIQCLPDLEIVNILLELKSVEDFQAKDLFLSKHGDWLVDQGISNAWSFKLNDKDALIRQLIKQLIYYRCLAEASSFLEGLRSVHGVFECISKHPLAFKALFCGECPQTTLQSLSEICSVNWSDDGTNYKYCEEVTIYAWELFLQAVEDKEIDVTFGDILVFITGAEYIPPLGFDKKIEIDFFSPVEGETRFPFASTCGITISLPRNISHPDLSNLLVRAIKDSRGFHKI
ncbi:G2/M phase-specific E3 ubiquitin-protein ligase-like [Mytilus galloprovincialis]|uniref:G2/M phase-specific E3 ubiquitin-protein ligase-like n=1 Tax=Mytilus galloprovincialis TaxID=29158 RepID=UPI003F7BB535